MHLVAGLCLDHWTIGSYYSTSHRHSHEVGYITPSKQEGVVGYGKLHVFPISEAEQCPLSSQPQGYLVLESLLQKWCENIYVVPESKVDNMSYLANSATC